VRVEFLTDEEAASYGRYNGSPSRAERERAFFLDDADKALIARRRGDHNRLGFSLQMTTVRSLGLFLADPLDVPNAVLEYLANQLDIADPSCVKRYKTRCSGPCHQPQRGGPGPPDEAGGRLVAAELDLCVHGRRAETTGDGTSPSPQAHLGDGRGTKDGRVADTGQQPGTSAASTVWLVTPTRALGRIAKRRL